MTSSVTQTPGLRFINASDARAEIPLIYNPTTGDYDLATSSGGLLNVANYVWNTGTLSWDKETQPGGGGGGGGACTIADGADVAEGSTGDAAWSGVGAGTVVSILKKIATLGGGATAIADGADVAEGATTDAAVITDTNGTVSGKLRGLVKWAFERMPASLGQKVMAASLPVVIASDQSAVPVSGNMGRTWNLSAGSDSVAIVGTVVISDGAGPVTVDGTVNVGNFPATQPISAVALPLPAGAATEATLATRLADATFTARINTLGQKTMANSTPVVLASDQASIPVLISDGSGPVTVDGTVAITGSVAITAAALPLPAGAATEATLTAINTKTPALGLTTAANSSPVVLASDGLGSNVGNPLFISGAISANSSATATAAPPTYPEGVASPLSQTLNGALRVDISNDEIAKYYRRLAEINNLTLAMDVMASIANGERSSGGRCDSRELR